jgi:hypothetical protein
VLQELPHQRRVLQEFPACSTFWPRATQRNSTLTRRQRVTSGAACCKNYHIGAACCKNSQRVAHFGRVRHNEIPLSLGGSVLQLRQHVARTTTSAPRVARATSVLHNIWPRAKNEIRLGSVLQEELPTKFDSHSAAACCKNYHISAACCKNFLALRAHKTRPGHEFIPQTQLFPRLK